MDVNTVDYYERREAREQHLAAGARDPDIAAIHRELAKQYRERIDVTAVFARA